MQSMTQHRLVDFHGLLLFSIYFWFHDLKNNNNNNLTLRMLQMCGKSTKLILNISKCVCIFNLVYYFIIIYVQHSPKLSYIKYYKIICASHGQLISYFLMCNFTHIVHPTPKVLKRIYVLVHNQPQP